jgi:hypothetical protein
MIRGELPRRTPAESNNTPRCTGAEYPPPSTGLRPTIDEARHKRLLEALRRPEA